MAANFWTSSRYKQLLEQEEVDVVNPLDNEKGITLEDFKLMKMHIGQLHTEIGSTHQSQTKILTKNIGMRDILEMEMKSLEALDRYLVVFHPYRSLSQGLANDMYKMDLILIHSSHLIASACIYIASAQRETDVTTWFAELHVDMNLVKNISMEILDFYEGHRLITEERINTAFSKLASKT